MRLTWTLVPEGTGTRLLLEQTGLEILTWWWRTSMSMGWKRMLGTLLPRALEQVQQGRHVPGPRRRRDYGVKTVPEGYAK
jgi:hypothetical protein